MSLYKTPQGEIRWASFENPTGGKGAAGAANHGAKGRAFGKLPPGETATLLDYRDGAGIVKRIWATVSDRSPLMLRSLVIRCYWDGAEKPAVEVPFGDFFCCGDEMRPFENELFASPEGKSFNAFIPMPFARSARITVTNESGNTLSHLFYDVNFAALDAPEPGALYLHAYWNREKATVLERDYTVLPLLKGKGHIVGTAFVVNANPLYDKQWWGEGEVKAYIDGDTGLPTLCGTGTEDYIGTGWGQGAYANRTQGCLVSDWEARKWVFYRLHTFDPINFNREIRLTIQTIGGAPAEELRAVMAKGAVAVPISCDDTDNMHFHHLYKTGEPMPEKGWVNYYRSDDFASLTWLYLEQSESGLPPLAPLAERI
jgi:hypothetical protein